MAIQDSYQAALPTAGRGVEISVDHFGVNSVATANFPSPGSVFDQFVAATGAPHIRYPGGTITEDKIDPNAKDWKGILDNNNPGYTELNSGERIQTLAGMLDYANYANVDVTFVFPTKGFLSLRTAGQRLPDTTQIDHAIKGFVDFLRANPNASHLKEIEIGNEYYYDGRMTAAEYGSLVNEIAPRLDRALSELSDEIYGKSGFIRPGIAVQAGAGWQSEDNRTILDALSVEAKSGIDSVIIHYYPNNLSNIGSFDRHLGQIEEWRADPLMSDVRYYATEWNIQNSPKSDFGFLQANSFVHAFQEMLIEGVDIAAVWGSQYRSLDTRLSTLSSRDAGDDRPIDTDLTITGEMFAAMREALPGLRSLDLDSGRFISQVSGNTLSHSINDSLVMFGNEEKFVGFGANRDIDNATDISINLGDYFGQDGHASIRIYVPTDNPDTANLDEGDSDSSRAAGDMNYVYTGAIPAAPITLTLPPGALVVVEVTLGEDGVWLEGQDPISASDFINDDDILSGSHGRDTIAGHLGNDRLSGGAGSDILFGGGGDDSLEGQAGADLLVGGSGNDVSDGGVHNDVLVDGTGSDSLRGGAGDDFILSHEGENDIYGGDGDDLIWLAGGTNSVAGGTGANTYVVSGGSETTLLDFDPAKGDLIDVSCYGYSQDELNSLLATTVESRNGDGPLELKLGPDAILTINTGPLDLDDLRAAMIADESDSRFGDSIAEYVNAMPFDMVTAFASSLPTEVVDILIGSGSGTAFSDALEPGAIAPFALGLNGDEVSRFIGGYDPEHVVEALAALDVNDLDTFFSAASDDHLFSMLGDVSTSDLTAWWQTLPEAFHEAHEGELFDAGLSLADYHDTDGGIGFPVPTYPIPEDDKDTEEEDGEQESHVVSGDCFVATVIYESCEHPDVWMLRWFRDEIFRYSAVGRVIVQFYWILGPWFARRLGRHRLLRILLRSATHRLVVIIAQAYGREIGRQLDHRPWPENRILSFRIAQHLKRRRG